jgi:hypothetical protein
LAGCRRLITRCADFGFLITRYCDSFSTVNRVLSSKHFVFNGLDRKACPGGRGYPIILRDPCEELTV